MNSQKLPTAKEMIPVLVEVLKQANHECNTRELEQMVSDRLALSSSQLLAQHDRSRTEFQYRLGWTRTYAKRQGQITSTRRGIWKHSSVA